MSGKLTDADIGSWWLSIGDDAPFRVVRISGAETSYPVDLADADGRDIYSDSHKNMLDPMQNRRLTRDECIERGLDVSGPYYQQGVRLTPAGVGSRWKTRDGSVVSVSSYEGPGAYPFVVAERTTEGYVAHYTVGEDGAQLFGRPQPRDLVSKIQDSPSWSRKNIPMCDGCLDYFPLALAYVSYVSKVGNDQHNPGQPLHWSREKSGDHADCIVRHQAQRGQMDTDGVRHSGKVAWRALAQLQIELEKAGWCLDKGEAHGKASQEEGQ